MVSPAVRKAILQTSLGIRFSELNKTLQSVLLELMEYLMLKWPEWPSAHTSSEPLFKLYLSFVAYMQHHLTDVVVNEEKYREGRGMKVEKGTDTDDLMKKKRESAFGLIVAGPSQLLNNIMFVSKDDGKKQKQKFVCVTPFCCFFCRS